MVPYLDFGDQPLANALRSSSEEVSFRAPLAVQVCTHCGLSQLTHVVDPERLYGGYRFRAGTSAGWRAHCDDFAGVFGAPGVYALDIGANDGTLMRALAARGCVVHGIDPAPAADDLPITRGLWGARAARSLVQPNDAPGLFDLITATNVLGHVDDVHDFMSGIVIALAPKGRLVIEAPTMPQIMRTVAFDTIYHEHLSYWTTPALATLLMGYDLAIVGRRQFPLLHGGTTRWVIERGRQAVPDPPEAVAERCLAFGRTARERIAQVDEALLGTGEFFGYGAAAKTAVLLNMLKARLRLIFDDTPAKQNLWMPGVDVQTFAPEAWPLWRQMESLVLFAWNWADDLKVRAKALGFRGRYFVPLPTPRWEDA